MSDIQPGDAPEDVRRACENAVIQFTAHFDAYEHEQMERYFSADGVWARHDGDIHGIDDLRSRMARRPSGAIVRHVITNLRTRMLSPDRASVESYVIVFRHAFAEGEQPPAPMGLPYAMGRYHDELVNEQGAWTIVERRSTQDFANKGRDS